MAHMFVVLMLVKCRIQWPNFKQTFGQNENSLVLTERSASKMTNVRNTPVLSGKVKDYNMGVSLEVILYSTTHVGPRHVLAHTCQ